MLEIDMLMNFIRRTPQAFNENFLLALLTRFGVFALVPLFILEPPILTTYSTIIFLLLPLLFCGGKIYNEFKPTKYKVLDTIIAFLAIPFCFLILYFAWYAISNSFVSTFGSLSSKVLLAILCVALISIAIWAYKTHRRGVLWAIFLPIILAFARYLRGDL